MVLLGSALLKCRSLVYLYSKLIAARRLLLRAEGRVRAPREVAKSTGEFCKQLGALTKSEQTAGRQARFGFRLPSSPLCSCIISSFRLLDFTALQKD